MQKSGIKNLKTRRLTYNDSAIPQAGPSGFLEADERARIIVLGIISQSRSTWMGIRVVWWENGRRTVECLQGFHRDADRFPNRSCCHSHRSIDARISPASHYVV